MESPNSSPSPNKGGAWKLSLVVWGLVILVVVIGRGSSGSHSSTANRSPDNLGITSSDTPNADAFTSGSGAYMDDREKKLYEADSSSRGYTDADRDFLKEHGVSEDEARAAETVLHDHGIDD